MRIPKQNRDLRRFVLRRDLKGLLLWLLWVLLWGTGAWAYNANHATYPPERQILGWRLALWLLAGAFAGFLLFRLRLVLFQRTLSGVLTSSGLSRDYAPSQDPGRGRASYDFRLHKVLRLRRPNGRSVRLRIEEKPGSYLYYREGDRLVRLHGLPYPINLDADGKTGYLCAACGRVYGKKTSLCEGCGLSLIDAELLGKEDGEH